MTRQVVFRPQAEDDAIQIQRWYEARREGLGLEFGVAVDDLVTRITTNPLAFPEAHADTRRAVLARFPYAIYFRVADEEIVVLALHGRQHESHWRTRA